jgi:hypothetical protein
VLVLGACLAALVAALVVFAVHGVHTGDRPGDAFVLKVEPHLAPRGAVVTLANPGAVPVVVGLSLRRARPRLRLEGASYVTIRARRTRSDLLAGQQSVIGVLAAGEVGRFLVAAGDGAGQRAELVAAIGQLDRLRAVHRLVRLPSADAVAGAHAARARSASVSAQVQP